LGGNNLKSEYDIHSIIKIHPYILGILGEDYKNLHLKHEKVYDDRRRADFIFSNDRISIVVEVKIGKIDYQTLKQLLHYLSKEEKENPNKRLLGIIVGHRIDDKRKLNDKIKRSGYEIQIKILGRDIPSEIKLCTNCRKINALWSSSCRYCGSTEFISDPFLFTSNDK